MAEVTLRLIETGVTYHDDGSVASLFIAPLGFSWTWEEGIQSAGEIPDIVDSQMAQKDEIYATRNFTDADVEREYNEKGMTLSPDRVGQLFNTTK